MRMDDSTVHYPPAAEPLFQQNEAKKTPRLLLIVLIFLLLLSTAATGFLYSQNNSLQRELQQAQLNLLELERLQQEKSTADELIDTSTTPPEAEPTSADFVSSIPLTTTPPLPTIPAAPANMISHVFNTHKVVFYTPLQWQSKIEEFTESSLIRFWKKDSPSIVPIQIEIKPNWENTGDAQTLPKNFTASKTIPVLKVTPPQKNERSLERYQTNYYFEHKAKVYIVQCVHDWQQDYITTCDSLVERVQFLP